MPDRQGFLFNNQAFMSDEQVLTFIQRALTPDKQGHTFDEQASPSDKQGFMSDNHATKFDKHGVMFDAQTVKSDDHTPLFIRRSLAKGVKKARKPLSGTKTIVFTPKRNFWRLRAPKQNQVSSMEIVEGERSRKNRR